MDEKWVLVFEDNFDGVLPSKKSWSYDIEGNSRGWGNNELQAYTDRPENCFIKDGVLHIRANKEDYVDPVSGKSFGYTSARLISKGKLDRKYGKFEIRAKTPKGRGIWPAIWFLPSSQLYGTWPRSGEIDLLEHVGHDQGRLHFSVHTESFNHMINTQKTNSVVVDDCSDRFMLYTLEWEPHLIQCFIDGETVFQFANEGKGVEDWPFDQEFHILVNVAVGGNWGGQKGVDDSIFPATLLVENVKVFEMRS